VEEKEDECSDEEGEEIEKETYKEAEECVHKEEDEYEMIEATNDWIADEYSPEKFALRLDHQYTDTNIAFNTLKDQDLKVSNFHNS
jgi:hypothetical protein